MISHTRQGVRFVIWALDFVFSDILYKTKGTICYRHWVLCLVIIYSQNRRYDLLQALGSASCEITHETKGAIGYGHWVLRFVISLTRQGAICAKLWVLRLMISHTKQGL